MLHILLQTLRGGRTRFSLVKNASSAESERVGNCHNFKQLNVYIYYIDLPLRNPGSAPVMYGLRAVPKWLCVLMRTLLGFHAIIVWAWHLRSGHTWTTEHKHYTVLGV